MDRVVATGCALAIALGWAAAGSAQMTFTLEEVTGAVKDEAEAPAAGGKTIAESLGELKWGMSKRQVLAVIKNRIRDDYQAQVKRERDVVRQDALYQQAKQRYARAQRAYVEFDGRKTGWDVSPVGDEFRHGSQESMLYFDDAEARDLYFFVGDRLWKWYRELKVDARDGSRYTALAAAMRAQFGQPRAQTERRSEASDKPFTGLTWQDQHTRVTLLQRGADLCLVYEDRQALAQLAKLREHALPRGPRSSSTVDQIVMTPAEREAWRNRQDEQRGPSSSRRSRR